MCKSQRINKSVINKGKRKGQKTGVQGAANGEGLEWLFSGTLKMGECWVYASGKGWVGSLNFLLLAPVRAVCLHASSFPSLHTRDLYWPHLTLQSVD